MKRLLSCALCALLLFSICGCTLTPTPLPQPTDAEVETLTPDPTVQTPSPLPSGVTVVTDYSAYAPKTYPQANYTRLTEEPILDLAVSGRGNIYPFAAAPLYSNGEDGYAYVSGHYYGFVTEDGCIVCDPTYIDVSTVNVYDGTSARYTALPLWRFSRTANVRDEIYGDYSWPEGDTLYGVAAMDGSFVLDCEFRSIIGTKDGFIAYRDWGTTDFEVYDLNGKLLFDGSAVADLPIDGSYCGLESGGDVYLYYNGGNYYALDSQGSVLFGPMETIYSYADGLAAASLDGDNYGYIDTAGNWVIAPQYESASSFRNGRATVQDGRTAKLIDRTGKVLLSLDNGYLSDCGDDYYFGSDNDDVERYYDRSGNLVLEGAPGEYWGYVGGSLFYASNDGSMTLRDLDSGKTLELGNADYFYSIFDYDFGYVSDGLYTYNGEPCYIAVKWVYDETDYAGYTVYTFISEDLEILGVRNDLYLYFAGDLLTGDCYQILELASGVREYYRPDGTLLGAFPRGATVLIADGNVIVTDDYSAKFIDRDGVERFCLPLLSVLED